ncbi:hypothetical protein ACNF42_02580 [Cuniculiplasma sp. SKW3]|uniref:hypothetical protein n=1 Tax=Cuniculiplasma sp. SKW3 TaxID=3400170 RepID=UPI003FD3E850
MADENVLKSMIEKSRKVSEDSNNVIYDLTSGFDFSKPKEMAMAIAEEFFEKDALKWFKVNDGKLEFEPSYRVQIVLSKSDHKKIENVVDDFMEDLKKKNIERGFSGQIRKDASDEMNLQTAITNHAFHSVIFHHSLEKVYKDEISDDIFTDLLEKLEIKSLDGKDLMDWKNLPL